MSWLFDLHETQRIAHAVGVLAFVCVVIQPATPLPPGSTPRPDSLPWPALPREVKTLPDPGTSDCGSARNIPHLGPTDRVIDNPQAHRYSSACQKGPVVSLMASYTPKRSNCSCSSTGSTSAGRCTPGMSSSAARKGRSPSPAPACSQARARSAAALRRGPASGRDCPAPWPRRDAPEPAGPPPARHLPRVSSPRA